MTDTAGWQVDVQPDDDRYVHVHPRQDSVGHSVEEDRCVCGPRLERETRGDGGDGWIVVHHSLDGREHGEDESSPCSST